MLNLLNPVKLTSYNPLRDEETTETQWKKEIYRDLLQGIFCLIFAFSFAINSATVTSEKCQILLAWGRAASFCFTMGFLSINYKLILKGFIIFCIVNPLLACTLPTLKQSIPFLPQNLINYIRYVMYLWIGIIFIGLIISLGYGERCSMLNPATGFFIFVVIIILFVIGLCYCFVLTNVGQQALGKAKEEIANYGTMQDEKKEEQQNKLKDEQKQQQDNSHDIKVNISNQDDKK